jgi:hypothetical protein
MRAIRDLAAFILCGLGTGAAAPGAGDLPRWEEAFALAAPAEAVAVVTAECEGCSWGQRGREAAVLRLEVDGRYSQHLVLCRAERAEYRVALGRLEAGAHRLSARHDVALSARGAGAPRVWTMTIAAMAPDDAGAAHAPILHARPNTVGRFSDLPLLLWYEAEPTPRGTRLRYSAVFSNEDGGTPPDRLMATWGRVTDIEYVYGVELDREGRVLAAEYQGSDHEIRPFGGVRQASHPLLYVATDNNMVADRGAPTLRFAPAPRPFDPQGVSREAIMDAEPWTYRVSADEVRREGRVRAGARPGSERIPDPRRFATVEACAATEDASLAFALGVGGASGPLRWFSSDAGLPAFRVTRVAHQFPNGCFRAAVALPEGTRAADLKAIRFRAFTRAPRKGEARLPQGSGRARLQRLNALFLLDGQDRPGPSLLSWQGDAALVPEGPAWELAITGPARSSGARTSGSSWPAASRRPR